MLIALVLVCAIAGFGWLIFRSKDQETGSQVDPVPSAPEPEPKAPAETYSAQARTAPAFEPGVPQPASPAASTLAIAAPPLREPQEPMAASHEEMAFIDFETTGLDPESDRVIEVGILIHKFEYSGNLSGYSELANPGESIPPRITELTGISDSMVAKSRPTGEVIAELLDTIGERPIAAYNAEFDVAFLKAEARRIGRVFDNDWVCIMKYVKAKHPSLPRYRLNDVCDSFGIFESESAKQGFAPHRAGYDTERAWRLFRAVARGDMPNPPRPSIRDLTPIYENLNKYHAIRDSAKKLVAQAKLDEASDLHQAVYGYRAAITLFKEASKVEVYKRNVEHTTLSTTVTTGDINCLNRLTMCLCKLKQPEGAEAAVKDYFEAFPGDANLKPVEAIRKRIAKAMSK